MLALPSELRLPRGFRVAFPEFSGESAEAETSRVIAFGLSAISDMADTIPTNFERQLCRKRKSDQLTATWRDVSTCAAWRCRAARAWLGELRLGFFLRSFARWASRAGHALCTSHNLASPTQHSCTGARH